MKLKILKGVIFMERITYHKEGDYQIPDLVAEPQEKDELQECMEEQE